MSSHVEEEHALKLAHGDQSGGSEAAKIFEEEEREEADQASTKQRWSAIIVISSGIINGNVQAKRRRQTL